MTFMDQQIVPPIVIPSDLESELFHLPLSKGITTCLPPYFSPDEEQIGHI